MKKKVLITRRIPEAGIDILKKGDYDITLNEEDRVLSHGEILKLSRGCNGILCLLTDRVDDEILGNVTNLEGIANYAVGFDNIDIDAATMRGIPVSNTPGVLTDATADLTLSLIFTVARRIVEADSFVREGKWGGWGPTQFLGADVWGATLGIIGMGKIGKAVALRGKGLNMNIVYYSPGEDKEIEEEMGISRVDLKELLSISDFVTLHVPLNSETRHLIGNDELEMMKETAFLINTSRGPVVDEVALAFALKNNIIAGAGLDVYENEPEITPELMGLKNVVMLPHIGSATNTARAKMAVMAAENLVAMLEGGDIPNLVNPDYTKRKKG